MKQVARYVSTFLLFSLLALADTWNGTLMDVMCKDKDPSTHTKDCGIKCSKSGYGVVLSDGKFLKFDDEGNTKALEALKATDKDKDLKVEVNGTLEEDTIKVESLEIED